MKELEKPTLFCIFVKNIIHMISILEEKTFFNVYKLLPEIYKGHDEVETYLKNERMENFFAANKTGNIADTVMHDMYLNELSDFPLFLKKYLNPTFMGHKISNISNIKSKVIRNSVGRTEKDILFLFEPIINVIIRQKSKNLNSLDDLSNIGEIAKDLFLSYFIVEMFNFYYGTIAQKKLEIVKKIESELNDNISFNIGLDNDKIDLLIHLLKSIIMKEGEYHYLAYQIKPRSFLNYFNENTEIISCAKIAKEYNARKCYILYDSEIFTQLNRFVFYYFKKKDQTKICDKLYVDELNKAKNSEIQLIKKELIFNENTENYEIVDYVENSYTDTQTSEVINSIQHNKEKISRKRNEVFDKFSELLDVKRKNTNLKIEKSSGRHIKINGEKTFMTFPMDCKWDKSSNDDFTPFICILDTIRKNKKGCFFYDDYKNTGIVKEDILYFYDKNNILDFISKSTLDNILIEIQNHVKNTITDEKNKEFVKRINDTYLKDTPNICFEIHDSGDNGRKYYYSISIKNCEIEKMTPKYVI